MVTEASVANGRKRYELASDEAKTSSQGSRVFCRVKIRNR